MVFSGHPQSMQYSLTKNTQDMNRATKIAGKLWSALQKSQEKRALFLYVINMFYLLIFVIKLDITLRFNLI